MNTTCITPSVRQHTMIRRPPFSTPRGHWLWEQPTGPCKGHWDHRAGGWNVFKLPVRMTEKQDDLEQRRMLYGGDWELDGDWDDAHLDNEAIDRSNAMWSRLLSDKAWPDQEAYVADRTFGNAQGEGYDPGHANPTDWSPAELGLDQGAMPPANLVQDTGIWCRHTGQVVTWQECVYGGRRGEDRAGQVK